MVIIADYFTKTSALSNGNTRHTGGFALHLCLQKPQQQLGSDVYVNRIGLTDMKLRRVIYQVE